MFHGADRNDIKPLPLPELPGLEQAIGIMFFAKYFLRFRPYDSSK
jgi:hypothetical protein